MWLLLSSQVYGQGKDKFAPSPYLALYPDVTFMKFYYILRYRKAQARSLMFFSGNAFEFIKYLREISLGNTRPGIRDLKTSFISYFLKLNVQGTAAGCVFYGVIQEVDYEKS